MLLYKRIVSITLLILLMFVGTGYGSASELPLYTVDEVVAAKKKNSHTIYVDTRREEDFQIVRIPSSINIPIHFVKTKAYLKDMDVILINQGYSYSQLQREGALLKEQGFRVAILAGGVAAWHQQGQRLAGDRFAEQTLHYISAAELLSENNSSFIKLRVNISPTTKSNIFTENSQHQSLTSVEDLPGLVKSIEAQDLDERSGVLIFDEKGEYSMFAALPELCNPTIFFLKGGIVQYQLELEQQQAILQPREQRLKKVGGCATCPSAFDPEQKEEDQ